MWIISPWDALIIYVCTNRTLAIMDDNGDKRLTREELR